MMRNDCLGRARDIINGDRATSYGDAYQNHGCIADLFNAYLSHQRRRQSVISACDVAVLMILGKVARIAHAPDDDSFVDICGYASLAAEMSKSRDD